MNLTYYGYFTPFGGYGIANINWAKYLRRAGVNVSVEAVFVPRPGTPEWEVLDDEERLLFKEPPKRHRIGLIETTPGEFGLNQCEVKIANTMAETDKIGDGWVRACNGMNEIIVPNNFYHKVFKDSGVTQPINVIPHGIDTDRFDMSRWEPRPIYTFGMCGYLNNRKGVFEVIRAFCSEFSADEPVKLLLHSSNTEMMFYRNFKDPRIELTTDLWNFEKIAEFYHSLDCFVFPSRAEGVGYPPREAMACGLPTIVMDYSGLSDIADERYSYPVHPAGWSNENPVLEQPGAWANIDIKELMYQMRWVYEHQDEARDKGFTAHLQMQKYSWRHVTLQLKRYLEAL